QVAMVVPSRVLVRAASTLSKEATRIEVRKQKRANCAVYGFGLSASGALSIPALVVQDNKVTSRETHKPLRISYCNLREIKKVSSGFGFSLFASRNKVYGSGLNNRLQIAGRLLDKGGAEEYYISGRRIGGLPDGKIVDIASGRAHSLVIVDDKVYAFGCNVHAQCGQDPATTSETVVVSGDQQLLPPVVLPTSSKPVRVHAALDTSFVLTEDGKVLAFGLNEDGQCANGRQGIQTEAREIIGDTQGERLVSLSGSTDTLMAVGESGRLFVWGQNEYGQAGVEHDEEIQLTASRAVSSTSLRGKKVVDAAATATTCVAATKDGVVFSWGVGVLGFGPDSVRLRHPTALPQTLFDGAKVHRVHAGNVAAAAISDAGAVFVWGQNRYGLLGLGHTRDQLFPFPLFFQEDVKQISIGPDHTLVVVK
ncbi:hypothetical protein PRIPAC_86959, partial [Pristionchus pacificus]